MRTIWRKVWRDIAHNSTRTLLVVLSTAVGLCALGIVFGLSGTMRTRMATDYQASRPAHITLWANGFDEEAMDAVRRHPNVAEMEGETYVPVRWKLPGESEWRNGQLVARTDYSAQRMNQVSLLAGSWPGERTVAIERQSAIYYGPAIGANVILQVGEREVRQSVGGIVRMPTVYPPQFGGPATFFVTPAHLRRLTGITGYSQIDVRLSAFDPARAKDLAKSLERRLKRLGQPGAGYTVSDPAVHPMQDTFNTLFLILTVLGALSLGLSAFLIVNTLNAVIAQQVWQIGIMKVIGASFRQVVQVYLLTVLVYGLLALALAVPLGAVGAHALARWLLDLINIEPGAFVVVPRAVLIQVVVGLSTPVLAALAPVIGGARISAYRAISSHGLAGLAMQGPERWLERIRFLPRPLALSLRNTFRRRSRVALTLLTLSLGGVVFIMVMSVSSSLDHTLEIVLRDLGSDVTASFERPHAASEIENAIRTVKGVARSEVWDYRSARLTLANGETHDINLWGVPADTRFFHPRIVNGRGLHPDDGAAVLLNRKIANEQNIKPGDRIKLTIGDKQLTWTVVGLVVNLGNNQGDSFVPFKELTRVAGSSGKGAVLMAQATRSDAAGQEALARDLRSALSTRKLDLSYIESMSEARERNRSLFSVVTYLMLAMAVMAAAVSSIGLMGSMSINVVERGREIGVLRALGATSSAIVTIFVAEGLLIGLLSWLIAVPLSIPGARLFSGLVSSVLMPLDFRYSVQGVFLWLTIVGLLSTVASIWPALHATDISVREALAYE